MAPLYFVAFATILMMNNVMLNNFTIITRYCLYTRTTRAIQTLMTKIQSKTFHVYTFSFNNPKREENMRVRFANLPFSFVKPVLNDDPRLAFLPERVRRVHAIMWNHLDMLKTFIESNNEFGIFCEDDIMIRRDFATLLPEVIDAYTRLNLEIMMLGYLVPFAPAETKIHPEFSPAGVNLSYLFYGDHTWGSQMYMLDRTTAQKFLNKYTIEYSIKSELDKSVTPFSPDWTLTKDGRRALVYPMLALEEGDTKTDCYSQIIFHQACHNAHISKDYT
jgi:hypothetical protein